MGQGEGPALSRAFSALKVALQMLKDISFAKSEFSGSESEKMELLRGCSLSSGMGAFSMGAAAVAFDNSVRAALDQWYIRELSAAINLQADERVAEELRAKISRLTILSRVYNNRKQFSKAQPLCIECYRCSLLLASAAAATGASAAAAAVPSDNSPVAAPVQAEAEADLAAATDAHASVKEPLPEPSSTQVLVVEAASRLALVYDALKEFELGRTLHNEVVETTVKLYGRHHEQALSASHRLALHLRLSGSFHEALDAAQQVVQVRKQSAEKSIEMASNAELLGLIHEDLVQWEQATAFHRCALDLRRELLGPDHADTWSSLNNLSRMLRLQGAAAKAEVLLREVLNSVTQALGEHDNGALAAAEALAGCLR